MTPRQEYELALINIDPTDFNATSKAFKIVAQYVATLEARITELEEFYIHRNEAQQIQDKNISEVLAHFQAPKSAARLKNITDATVIA